MAASGSFFVTISCVIRRYHVYKEVWSPNIGENFVCFDEKVPRFTAGITQCPFYTCVAEIRGRFQTLEFVKISNFWSVSVQDLEMFAKIRVSNF